MQGDVLRTVIAATPIPQIFIGQNERIECLNAPARGLFGETLIGMPYVSALRQPAVLDCIEDSILGQKRSSGTFKTAEGTRQGTYRVQAIPVSTTGATGTLVSFEDIGHAEDAREVRRDFVANVSHELRTPLTAMQGFIETLRGAAKSDPKTADRFLAMMQDETDRMVRLVRDLLSLSRVESDERVRPMQNVDLSASVSQAISTLGGVIEDSGVAVDFTPPDRKAVIPGDPDQMVQVFSNLIENGIKYGRDRVEVSFSFHDRDAALGAASIRVRINDNGDGIDALHIPRLTERFYRVDNHRSRAVGGTGLGLAIVKHIVNRHRGRFRMSSTLGEGSSFIVILRTN